MDNKRAYKFLIVIGGILIVVGLYVMIFDFLIGLLGATVGVWNVYKGIRLKNNKEAYFLRKYREINEQRIKEEYEKKQNTPK